MSTRTIGSWSRVGLAVITALAFASIGPTAAAEVTVSVVDGVLTIVGDDADDQVQIRCRAGDVTVNDANPGTGAAACSSIVGIDFRGGEGDDSIDLSRLTAESFAALTATTLVGGAGNDRLTGGPVADTIEGGAGSDRMAPGGGVDSLLGGKDADSLSLRVSGDLVLSDDALTHAGGSSTLAGFESAQVQAADAAVAVSFDASGFSGAVTLSGSDLDDVLIGGRGDDRISGGAGADTLRGGAGDDSLDPGTGTGEIVDGGKGTDTLTLQADGDLDVSDRSMSGVVAGSIGRVESLRLSGGAGNDSLDAAGFSGVATIDGGDGNDVVVTGDAADVVSGGAGNDRLTGGDGDDRMSGDDGDDVLRGGRGDDRMDGGAGRDTCQGGPGSNNLTSC